MAGGIHNVNKVRKSSAERKARRRISKYMVNQDRNARCGDGKSRPGPRTSAKLGNKNARSAIDLVMKRPMKRTLKGRKLATVVQNASKGKSCSHTDVIKAQQSKLAARVQKRALQKLALNSNSELSNKMDIDE